MKEDSSGLSRAGVRVLRDRGSGTDQALLHVPDNQGGGAASQAQDSKIPGPGRAPATLLPVGGKPLAQPGRCPAGGASAKRLPHASHRSDSDARPAGRAAQWATVVLREEWLERACGTRAGCGSKPHTRGWTAVGGGTNSRSPPAPGIKPGAKGQRAGAVIGHDSPGHSVKGCSVRQKQSMRHRPSSGPVAATLQVRPRLGLASSCGHGAVDFCVIFRHPPSHHCRSETEDRVERQGGHDGVGRAHAE